MTDTPKPSRKRFIAGAKCPACGLEDKIVMYAENDLSVYECIDCGHREQEKFEQSAPLPETKKTATPKPEVVEQPLQFFPMPAKKKDSSES